MKRKTARGKARKENTWGDIYRKYTVKGWDHGYAAHMADQWELKLNRRLK